MKALLFTLMMATLLSLSAWAGFNYTWWAPLDQDPGRGFMLYIMHVFSLLGYPIYRVFNDL